MPPFERHKQPWTSDELQTLHRMGTKGASVRAIAKALTRTEESVKAKAKDLGLKLTKLH